METHSVRGRIWRYGPVIIWMAFILLASSSGFSAINTSRIVRPLLVWFFPDITEETINLTHFLVRKAAHVIEYAILGWLTARALSTSSRKYLRQRWLLAGLLPILSVALVDEYHQSFVPSRTGSVYDSAIDIAGGLLGLLSFAFLRPRVIGGRKSAYSRRE